MALHDKLKVELVFFQSKGSDGRQVFKLANFMFVEAAIGRNFIMPTPINLQISREAGKVQKSKWFEIVGLHVYDGLNIGLPIGKTPVQYFGDV